MTDTFDQYLEDDPDSQPQVTMARKDARRLAKAAKAGREAVGKLEQLERERAFVQAGVPIEDKRASYFIAGYQGETNPEAIKAAWTDAFGSAQPEGDPALDQELADLSAGQDLVSGGMGAMSESKLAERNAKLAQISPTDPRAGEKFDAIFNEYGGQMAAQSGLPHGR